MSEKSVYLVDDITQSMGILGTGTLCISGGKSLIETGDLAVLGLMVMGPTGNTETVGVPLRTRVKLGIW